MRVMLVSDKPDIHSLVSSLLEDRGHFLVQYQHPLKALDNMDEFQPELVIWDHNDFPRHWKICASWCFSDGACNRMILVSETGFSEEETRKADSFPGIELVGTGFFSSEFPSCLDSLPAGTNVRVPSPPLASAPAPASSRKAPSFPGVETICFSDPAHSRIFLGPVVWADGDMVKVRLDEGMDIFRPLAANTCIRGARGIGTGMESDMDLQYLACEDSEVLFMLLVPRKGIPIDTTVASR